jgi:hypothetical protein
MKKLILLLLLIPSLAWGQVSTSGVSLSGCSSGGVSAAAANYTDCSQINGNGNTNSFAWFGDHASGTTYGCKDSSTSIDATYKEGTQNNTTPSTSYSKEINQKLTEARRFNWAITGGDIVSVTEGFWQIDVYMATTTGVNVLLYVAVDGDNTLRLRINADGTATFTILTGGSYIEQTTANAISDNTWTTVYARYKVIGVGSQAGVKLGAGNWASETKTLSAWVGTPAYVETNVMSWADEYYFDNIFISKSSGL